jgi:hypothetical protein
MRVLIEAYSKRDNPYKAFTMEQLQLFFVIGSGLAEPLPFIFLVALVGKTTSIRGLFHRP